MERSKDIKALTHILRAAEAHGKLEPGQVETIKKGLRALEHAIDTKDNKEIDRAVGEICCVVLRMYEANIFDSMSES